jgi:hypothetical protein
MTISGILRTAGPYIGNSTTTVFGFTFKVFSTDQLEVVKLNTSTGVETTLTLITDYTVTLNGNQNSNPGGSVTLPAVLATGYNLTLTSSVANLQPTDLTNQGGFYPEVITDALDRATIQIQQMSDDVTRSIKAPLSDDPLTMDMTLPVVADRINKILAFDGTGMPTVVAQSPSSITGNTTIVGTLDVTGATTLSSTLGVTGATTLASVGVTGAATVGTTLGVTGATTIQGITVGKGGGTISNNTVVGSNALSANTTGVQNNAVGTNALLVNTTGNYNNAFGTNALSSNLIGNFNNAFGTNALSANTASNNNAFGVNALLSNTTGAQNCAVGYNALSSNLSGNYSSAFGTNALPINTASNNNAFGVNALLSNTTGFQNCAFGTGALATNLSGNNMAAFGYNALNANSTGGSCTAVGSAALFNSTGAANTAIGHVAGNTLTTGANVTCVGYNAQPATATTSNEITLGDINISSLRCQDTTISAVSDRRDKTNIIDIPTGLEFITAIRPVSFVWDMRGGGQVGTTAFGFIAQELLEAQTTVGITIPKLVSQNNPDRLEVGPAALLPVMVKAIQELNAKFEAYVATHP